MKIRRIGLFHLVLAVLLAVSCGVTRNYERPQEMRPLADSLYSAEGDTVSFADIHWHDFFTDPLLRDLIDTALVHNADLQLARLRTQEAEARLRASRLALWPSVEALPQLSVNHYSETGTVQRYNVGLAASWELGFTGRVRNARKGSVAALEQQKAYAQAVRTALVAGVAENYYTLLMLDEQLRVNQRTAENWAENLRMMQAMKRTGRATALSVAQSEANKLAVESSVIRLRQQIAALENNLCTLVGVAPRSVSRGRIQGQEFPSELAAGVPSQLLERRPDVRQAEMALAAAFYETNIARGAFLPSVTLGGSLGWTNGNGVSFSDPSQWLAGAVASLVQPIFARGRLVADRKVAEARQEEALVTYRQTLLQAGAEVNNALISWEAARDRLQADKEQVAALIEAVRSAELLMKHSSQNYLEVIVARQSLLNAELTCVSDSYDEIQSVIALYRALGGGAE